MPAARPTQALIERSLAAWQAAGLTVGGMEVSPDGTIRIVAPTEAHRLSSRKGAETCDDIFKISG